MSVAERRQTWLWTVIVAIVLVLIIAIVISARSRPTETATVIEQTPAGAVPPSAAPPAAPVTPAPSTAPAAQPAQPGTKVVKKEVKVVEKPVPVPVPAPGAGQGDAASGPTRTNEPAAGTFEQTGLPNHLNYQGKEWTAIELIEGLPSGLVAADAQKAKGLTVYHDNNAEPPYSQVYVKVPGQTDQYVRYMPGTS